MQSEEEWRWWWWCVRIKTRDAVKAVDQCGESFRWNIPEPTILLIIAERIKGLITVGERRRRAV